MPPVNNRNMWKIFDHGGKKPKTVKPNSNAATRKLFKQTFFQLLHELNAYILDFPSIPKTVLECRILFSVQLRLVLYHIWTKLTNAFAPFLTAGDKIMYAVVYRTIMINLHNCFDTIETGQPEIMS